MVLLEPPQFEREDDEGTRKSENIGSAPTVGGSHSLMSSFVVNGGSLSPVWSRTLTVVH